MLGFYPRVTEDPVAYVDVSTGTFGSVFDFAFLMGVLWNERAGRALAKEDRQFSEWVDIGGEG